jgi:CheY-like chemotaxis protein
MTTILVIDDEPILLKNIAMMLEFENFDVLTTIDGKTALDILQQHPVNLILCDLLMHPVDGLEIFNSTRQNPKTKRIPFVFITGVKWSSPETEIPDTAGYLIKPFSRNGLLDMVNQQLATQPHS